MLDNQAVHPHLKPQAQVLQSQVSRLTSYSKSPSKSRIKARTKSNLETQNAWACHHIRPTSDTKLITKEKPVEISNTHYDIGKNFVTPPVHL